MEYLGIGILPLIIGISECIKKTGFNVKYIPIINIVLGLLAGVFLLGGDDVKAGIVYGLSLGLSASGLYSGTVNVIEGIKEKKENITNL